MWPRPSPPSYPLPPLRRPSRCSRWRRLGWTWRCRRNPGRAPGCCWCCLRCGGVWLSPGLPSGGLHQQGWKRCRWKSPCPSRWWWGCPEFRYCIPTFLRSLRRVCPQGRSSGWLVLGLLWPYTWSKMKERNSVYNGKKTNKETNGTNYSGRNTKSRITFRVSVLLISVVLNFVFGCKQHTKGPV